MSKKTRKKSSKSGSGRPAAKTGGAKAAKTATAAAKKAAAKVAGKASKKAAGRSAVTAKKASAKVAKRSTPARTPAPASGTQSAALLDKGDNAPAFSLPRDGGQVVSLADYAGRKLVLFFYPRANTPGCTLEAIAFSRLADAFTAAGTAVLGVSADSVAAQDKFRDKHDLTVPLVSDETRGMLEAYGVWREKSLYGKTFMGIVRTTVLVDGNGRIVKVWRKVKVNGHADEVLAAARAA